MTRLLARLNDRSPTRALIMGKRSGHGWRSTVRRSVAGGLVAMVVVVVTVATAWACVSGPAINLATMNVKPGEKITIEGTGFPTGDRAIVRWNALDGPTLGTLEPQSDPPFSATITVPTDTNAGSYLLIVTPTGVDGTPSDNPVRALVTVIPDRADSPPGGRAPSHEEPARATGADTSPSPLSPALLASTVTGLSITGLVVPMVAILSFRRRPLPAAVPVHR